MNTLRRWLAATLVGEGVADKPRLGLAVSGAYIVVVGLLCVSLFEHRALLLTLVSAVTLAYLAVALLISRANR